MSNIQSGINQLLNTAYIFKRLSPSYENEQEAKALSSRALGASAGIRDIEKNVKTPGKLEEYSDTQLTDVSKRLKEHNKVINEYRTSLEDPRLKKYLEKDKEAIGSGSKYRDTLKNIENRISEVQYKRERWKEKALNKLSIKKDTAELRKSIILGADAKPLMIKENKDENSK